MVGAFNAINYLPILTKYQDPGTKYALSVLNGKEEAGYLIKLASFRHLQDLRRAEIKQDDFRYVYDLAECRKILNFAAICPDVQTGVPLPLMMWQKFILCQAVGWRNEFGYKRFDQVLFSVARANGKSYISNILLWYAFLFETKGDMNADIGYIMPISDQLKKVWPYLETTGHKLEAYKPFKRDYFDKYDISIRQYGIDSKKTFNKILRLSNESGNFDSYHMVYAVIDEAADPHYSKSDNIGKVTTGQLHVPNHQIVQISTAYDSIDTQFYRDEQRLKTVMEKDYDRKEDNYLCLVWEQDSINEVFQPEHWIKSNPILGLDQSGSVLDGMVKSRDSKEESGKLSEFENRNLNIWLQTRSDSYIKLKDVKKTRLDHFDITGRDVYVGLDISMSSDNTALGFVFPYESEQGPKIHLLQHSFVPWANEGSLDIKEKRDDVSYRQLAEQGYCSITSDKLGIIDIGQVYEWFVDFIQTNQLQVKYFGYDFLGFYKIQDFANTITRNFSNWPVEAVKQQTSNLLNPVKFMQEKFITGEFTHPTDPIMEKAFLNAITKQNNVGIFIDKPKSGYKIDVVDALIDGLNRAMVAYDKYAGTGSQIDEINSLETPNLEKFMKEHGYI
ncbi:terminase TerL endonuclease subunit [Oenococcus sicerae]|uniref:terminase TerL endonuclease subunit n=1 Tax=Oenococcus sicerae TaxID=2203724 RepID=UPI0039E8F193